MKNIVILGAGTAGTIMANKLVKKLNPAQWNITVIDKCETHFYQPSFIFIPFGLYGYKDLDGCAKPVSSLLFKGIRYLQDEIREINRSQKKVITKTSELSYDYLIAATGVRLAPAEIKGLSEGYGKNIFYFYTPESAMEARKPISDFKEGRFVIEITETPIKCPVAPIEFAALADYYYRQKGIREGIEIEVVTSQGSLFTKPVAGAILSEMFEKKEIRITPNFSLAEVDPVQKKIKSYDNKTLDYDLLVSIPPNLGADFYDDCGIGDGAGFVMTNPATLKSIKDENIYALGDCTNLATSKAGSTAHFEAHVAARNLVDEIEGRPAKETFDGHALCYVESGYKKAHLIDFNFKQQPVPGKLPFPLVGPFSLLSETRINHLGKLAFRFYYWNFLLKDRLSRVMELMLPSKMSLAGKNINV